MANKLWKAATTNAFSTTLDGSITDSSSSIVLTSTTGLQAPGVLVIDRQDGNGENTTAIREYVTFTSISDKTLNLVGRGAAGSTAQSHSSGALVEEALSVTHWNDLLSFLEISHNSLGGIASTSLASLSALRVHNHLDASGASISGIFPIHPGWLVGRGVSLPTTTVGKPLPVPQSGTIRFFSAVLRSPASGSDLIIDINKNFSTIFTDQGTRLTIPGGGTYASTASIAVTSIVSGDILSMDIDQGGGSAQDLTVLGRIE